VSWDYRNRLDRSEHEAGFGGEDAIEGTDTMAEKTWRSAAAGAVVHMKDAREENSEGVVSLDQLAPVHKLALHNQGIYMNAEGGHGGDVDADAGLA
jgi:hypothetical protein